MTAISFATVWSKTIGAPASSASIWAGRELQVRNTVVSGGTRTEEEVRQGDYLEVVEFSDFQVSPMGGDIAGEIRLGYLHQDGKVRIVSGGSVTGQMSEAIPTMEFSNETEQYDTDVIPRVTKLKT